MEQLSLHSEDEIKDAYMKTQVTVSLSVRTLRLPSSVAAERHGILQAIERSVSKTQPTLGPTP